MASDRSHGSVGSVVTPSHASSPRDAERAPAPDSADAADLARVGKFDPEALPASRAEVEPTFADDDYVTVILIHQYRAILEGHQRRNATVFFGAKDHGVVTFRGGIAREVPYAVAAAWLKLPQYRGALKIIPNDTSEALYAQKIGLQPRHASVIAAEMEASDLESVITQMTPAMRQKLRRLLENA